MNKRVCGLHLKQDFFVKSTVKKLCRSEYGNKAAVLYLEMMLLSIRNNGTIEFEDAGADIYEEIAIVLDESRETVKEVCELLQKMGRLEMEKGGEKA